MSQLTELITAAGLIGIALVTYAETGLLIGILLPGDSVLFTAGLLASQHLLNIWVLIPILLVSAIAGDLTGYYFGKKMGPKIFTKEDSFFFHKDNLVRSEVFFEKHGPKTVMMARFLPFVRSFAPILAGVGKMHIRSFMLYSIIGACLWAIGICLAGFFLGRIIPNADKYIFLIISIVFLLSISPSLIQFGKKRENRDKVLYFIKKYRQRN